MYFKIYPFLHKIFLELQAMERPWIFKIKPYSNGMKKVILVKTKPKRTDQCIFKTLNLIHIILGGLVYLASKHGSSHQHPLWESYLAYYHCSNEKQRAVARYSKHPVRNYMLLPLLPNRFQFHTVDRPKRPDNLCEIHLKKKCINCSNPLQLLFVIASILLRIIWFCKSFSEELLI